MESLGCIDARTPAFSEECSAVISIRAYIKRSARNNLTIVHPGKPHLITNANLALEVKPPHSEVSSLSSRGLYSVTTFENSDAFVGWAFKSIVKLLGREGAAKAAQGRTTRKCEPKRLINFEFLDWPGLKF